MIGKRVGVVANSGGAAIAETYNKNRGNAIRLFSSRDLDRMVIQLRDRQLDAMILDEPVAVWQVRNNPNFTIVGEPLIPIRLVAIVNKDDVSLKKAIDKALTEMRQEGKLEQILKRWNLWESQKTLKSTKVLPVTVLAIITPYSVYQ
jgi:polar amino acid transport system substrate-binding protein